MIRIGEIILELSEIKFMNLPHYVFDVDHVAKIGSELSITVLEKKIHKITAQESELNIKTRYSNLALLGSFRIKIDPKSPS